MGDLMPGIPSVPGDETSWANFVDQFETLKRGDMPLSLTNWDDLDLVPSIAAGAGIEIAGATYRFTVESLISDDAGLVSGTVYVVIKTADPTVNEATAYFTNVAPEWRDDLNGWYDTTGENRYTGHVMDWDGASAYTNKRYLDPGLRKNKKIITGTLTTTPMLVPHGMIGGSSIKWARFVSSSSVIAGQYTNNQNLIFIGYWDDTNVQLNFNNNYDAQPYTLTLDYYE